MKWDKGTFMKILLALVLLSTSLMAQVRPITIPTPIPGLQLKPEYRRAVLQNRGLQYIRPQVKLSGYFTDITIPTLNRVELNARTQQSLELLRQDILVHRENFNKVLLKNLIDSYNQQQIREIDIDALLKLVMKLAAQDNARELTLMMEQLSLIKLQIKALNDQLLAL